MSDRAPPPNLAAAIERLYAVFAGYRFESTAPCACCHSEEEREWRQAELPIAILSLVPDARRALDGFRRGPVPARHLA